MSLAVSTIDYGELHCRISYLNGERYVRNSEDKRKWYNFDEISKNI